MKESEIFKNEKAVLKNKTILAIQANVKRIKDLLTAENSENKTEGYIYFSEVVLFEKINNEIKKEIVGINTDGQFVDIIDTTGDGSTEKLDLFGLDILIEILSQLENIKTFADINLSI